MITLKFYWKVRYDNTILVKHHSMKVGSWVRSQIVSGNLNCTHLVFMSILSFSNKNNMNITILYSTCFLLSVEYDILRTVDNVIQLKRAVSGTGREFYKSFLIA